MPGVRSHHKPNSLDDDVNIRAATGDDIGNLVELWAGHCHHDFVITGGNARLASDGEYPSTGPKSEKKAPRDVHGHHM